MPLLEGGGLKKETVGLINFQLEARAFRRGFLGTRRQPEAQWSVYAKEDAVANGWMSSQVRSLRNVQEEAVGTLERDVHIHLRKGPARARASRFKGRNRRENGSRRNEKLVSTLRTTWIIICRPFLPGYFPAMFSADKLKRLAPVSLQMAWTSIFFPTPEGPASSSDFTKGAFSCTSAEPARGRGPSSESRQEAGGAQTRLPPGTAPHTIPVFVTVMTAPQHFRLRCV